MGKFKQIMCYLYTYYIKVNIYLDTNKGTEKYKKKSKNYPQPLYNNNDVLGTHTIDLLKRLIHYGHPYRLVICIYY